MKLYINIFVCFSKIFLLGRKSKIFHELASLNFSEVLDFSLLFYLRATISSAFFLLDEAPNLVAVFIIHQCPLGKTKRNIAISVRIQSKFPKNEILIV